MADVLVAIDVESNCLSTDSSIGLETNTSVMSDTAERDGDIDGGRICVDHGQSG